jgi:large subunit ribosomal protein L5e
MVFVKAVKTNAYFKRFQVKYRRRREGKTDYAQRRALVQQDKNKYLSPKYRLVVRLTNGKIICQVIYATIQGDRVLATSSSQDLIGYGVTVGLKNYSAAYCAGLLCARRLLKKVGLDTAIVGKKDATGDEYHVADDFEGERRPFKCVLDIGLHRTTVGARIFGALKGATDGGLDIPHSIKKFPGYVKGEGDAEPKYNANVHKDRIFGKHVGDYMKKLKAEDASLYERHFGDYIKKGITADKIEAMYKKAHAGIRANPNLQRKPVRKINHIRAGNTVRTEGGNKYTSHIKYNVKQREARVRDRIMVAQQRAIAAAQA